MSDNAPNNTVYPGVVAAVLKHFAPDLNTSQPIPEQPKHVALCVATACTMTNNGWLAYREATSSVLGAAHPDQANLL
eukprot:1267272-Amphidinium_carterae.1